MADDLEQLVEKLDCSEKDEDGENKHVFLVAVKTRLEDGKGEEIKRLLCDDKYENFVKTIGWDLIPVLCTHIGGLQDDSEDCTLDILNRIAEVCNPKEILLVFLEEVDKFLENAHFRKLIKPIQTVLRRIPRHSSLSMNIVFSTFHAHVQTIKLPNTTGMNKREVKQLMEEDKSFEKVERTVTALLDFVAPFVFQVHIGLKKTLTEDEQLENERMKSEVERFLLKLLDYPLAQMDLSRQTPSDDKKDSDEENHSNVYRTCAEQIMHYLRSMLCSYNRLMNYGKINAFGYEQEASRERDKDGQDEEDEMSENIKSQCSELLPLLGLSCFSYLTIVEEIEGDHLPSVYSPLHLLEINLMYIISLFRRPEDTVISKGIELTFSLVEKADDGTIPHTILDKSGYMEIAGCMERVMVGHPSKPLRQRAVQFLLMYIKKFNYHGRYKLLRHLVIKTKHSGVAGLLVGVLKDQVDETLKVGKGTEWFTGSHMINLLKAMMKLDKGPLTDLLQESDRIMAVLNCLRFLFLRDSITENKSGIWNELEYIEKEFLEVLEKGIGMSKSHFAQELEIFLQERKNKEKSNVNVSVSGEPLPGLPPQQQLQVLKSAQQMLDVMNSIVARVYEVIGAEKKKGV
ncbi:glomulin-like [Ptychodera flava]|uniref:glomulin-like n=1 Tax=Ptychodera flava TaxID=63121 RepID=UPI00396A86CA